MFLVVVVIFLVSECDSILLESPRELVVGSESDFSIEGCPYFCASVILEISECTSGYKHCPEYTLGDSVVVSDGDELAFFPPMTGG